MDSEKQIQVAAAVAQMMALMQDELAFNDSELSGKYSNSLKSLSSFPRDSYIDPVPQLDLEYDQSGGNYSFNSSFFPDSSGSEPTPTDDYVPYSMRPETYIIPIVFAIIFIIGVIGNGTLIAIFLKHRSMRNVPNMYICSLAVGDILVIFFCVPFTSTVYTVESWPYGVVVCKFSEFIKDLSIGVSVFTLTALSADRYFAIVDPMRKLTGRRATRITCITICGIWLISILFAFPSLIFSFVWTVPVEGTNKTFDVCYPFPKELTDAFAYPKVVVMFKFLVYYAIPLCFIASFYIIMAHHLLQSARNMPGEAQGQVKQIQSRKKVAKMVLSFVVIFAICFFPSHVFLIWFYYYPNAETHYNLFWHWVRMVGFCLSFINSCINPITLYCVSGTFRKHFNRHLFCCCLDERHPLLLNHPHHNQFIKTQANGYHAGGVLNQPNHHNHILQHHHNKCTDRIHVNGAEASHISRLSKSTPVIDERYSEKNREHNFEGSFGNGNNHNKSISHSHCSLNGSGNINEFEMTTRKMGKRHGVLSSTQKQQSDKFEMIKAA